MFPAIPHLLHRASTAALDESSDDEVPVMYDSDSSDKVEPYPWSSDIDEQVPNFFDPACYCGGGEYLGHIRSTAMYKNHLLIDCIVYPRKTPMPYLSPEYFNALKTLEMVATTRYSTYEEKVVKLLQIWHDCSTIIDSDVCTGTHVFLHYAISESAYVILNPDWKNISREIKDDFSLIFNNILITLHEFKVHLDSIKSCHFMLSFMKNPWGHHYLLKLLHGDPSKEEIANFIEYEKSNIFALRLKILCEESCEDEALRLSFMAMNLVDFKLKSRYITEEVDFLFIRDIYYACLEKLNKRKELIDCLLKYTPKNDGQFLMERYCTKIQFFSKLPKESLPRICKSMIDVCEMAACILVSTALKKCRYFEQFSVLVKKWSFLMKTLMESNLKSDMYSRIKNMVRKYFEIAPSSNYLYLFIDIFSKEFGSKFPLTFYLEMYIRALNVNLNEKERCKQIYDTEGSLLFLKKLVQGYLKLANILEDIPIVCRECVLTAYSLMPSSDLLVRVENLAIKSGKVSEVAMDFDSIEFYDYIKKVKPRKYRKTLNSNKDGLKIEKHEPETKPDNHEIIAKFMADYVKNDSYTKIHSELGKLPEPLSPDMQDNLISVIKLPRVGTFNWNLDWKKLKLECLHYLKNLDLIIKRNTLKHSDLKFIRIDIEKYNELTAMNLRKITNERGFFSSDNDFNEEDSLPSAVSSGEVYSGKYLKARSRKRKSRQRKRKMGSRKRPANSKSSKARPLKKLKVEQSVIPRTGIQTRHSFKFQNSFEENDDSTISSSLNDETQSTNTISTNENGGNSIDLVLNENVEVHNDESNKASGSNITSKPTARVKRERRIVNKNQHKDFDYSWNPRRKSNKSNKKLVNSSTDSMNNIHNFDLPSADSEHLNMLSERVPQLSSLDFIRPVNTDQIINVVQIQATSKTLTNVSQTQTDHVTNRHSNNEIEKKINDSQNNTQALDGFVSVYQSNSLNNINYIQNPGTLRQGECSFSRSVSVSNQKIATDSISSILSTGLLETSKPIGTHDLILNQNQMNLDHRRWNDINLQTSGERLQSTIENAVHLSSNVIVRTSDINNPSHVTSNTGQITNAMKKTSAYNIKTRERFDLSLPASISSVSTNCNRSTNIHVPMNSNKSNFDSKVHQISPVQTSIGLQVNFNNPQSEGLHSMISSNDQPSQICTNITDNSTSNNLPVLNDQIMNSINSNRISTSVNASFIKENNLFDNLKSNISIANPVSSTQTQTCIGLRPSNEVSNPNSSVISLMIASTQSQVIKTNVHNSSYICSQNQRMLNPELSHSSQTNRSDEQKKIDNLKLISQTFTATSEAIKFVTSSSESQRLIHNTDKNSDPNLAIFQNTEECVSNVSQENDLNSKSSNKVRGNMRTYESKTRALKQANMSDMFVFEKGTLYAVQDEVINQIEPSKLVISPRNNSMTNVKIQNKQTKESLEKPKPSPNASPNVTITGSMLPRFQQVFGKTKFQSSSVMNDTSSLCSSNVTSIPASNPGPIINRTNLSTSRVYSSSKGVQTNNDIDSICSNVLNCLSPKLAESKLQHNINMAKCNNVMTLGNNKNNVIMKCKTVSCVKNIPHVSASSSHQLVTSNIDNNIVKKEVTGLPIPKVPTAFTTSCNNSTIASSSSSLVYSIPIQNDSKVNSSFEKSLQGVTQIQRQLKVTPSIIQTVLRKHPTWQQNCFRQGKQNTEVQTTSTVEKLISANIVKTTIDSLNNKISISANKSNVSEPNVSSSMMEQMMEFESVLEEVRKTEFMNELSTASMLPQINDEIIQIHSPTENVDLLNTDSNQTLFPLNKKSSINNERDHCSFSFINQTLTNVSDLATEEKEPVSVPPTITSVCSVTDIPTVTSPKNNNVSVIPVDGSTQCSNQIANKVKPVIKTPASSPSTSTVKVPVLQKPLPKLQEDEQTTQRIYAILDKYAEQLRNSPELKNKPAPRRRTNPPTNPSLNTKRKKSTQLNLKTCSQQTSCSSSGMEMSPTSDIQAIDSDDSSNAVSHFSHIINSPSRISDEQTTTTVISETSLIENALINVQDVIKKMNVDAEIKSKVSQSTQIVVSGTSGSFLSIPEGSGGNVRLLVAAGNNQKMYRIHGSVTGPGPVLFHQVTTKDSCSNDVKMSSNILGQSINESTILSALSTDDLHVTNTGLGNEILLNASQNSTMFERKINKSDIILESMEKAQVLDNNDKQLPYPVLKKNQASQSTFSVIHSLPCKPKLESSDDNELSVTQNNILENIQKNYCDNESNNSSIKQEIINNSNNDQVVHTLEKLSKTLKEEPPFIPPGSSESTSIPFEDLEFPSFHSNEVEEENNQNTKNCVQNITKTDENKIEIENSNQISVNCLSDSDRNKLKSEDNTIVNQEVSSTITTKDTSNILHFSGPKNDEESKPNLALSDIAAASAAEIISTANQTSNAYKHKEDLSPKPVRTDFESENENENTLSNTVYNMLDDRSASNINTKIGSLTLRLKNDRSSKNWNNCLSKIMPPGTQKILEGENLKQLQESFQHTKINTFKDLKIFVFEQCKKFDHNVENPREYDLYDDIDGLGVDKPSTNELFPEVAILNDLDKSVSPTLGLLQASTSKLNDSNVFLGRRKSVLSHTTTSTMSTSGIEQTSSCSKKNKTKVSFLKQALYNEMNQDSNDCETKPFINGTKTMLDSIEHIDSCPESPSNTTAADSEACMSEDSTSTISSGTPHYNFRKIKRKNIEEDGFIESQVIKRMYRGRTSEDNEEKSELPKLTNTKLLTAEQKSNAEKRENNRRLSNRLKNSPVKIHEHVSNKSPQMDSPPDKMTTTRTSLRRVSRKST